MPRALYLRFRPASRPRVAGRNGVKSALRGIESQNPLYLCRGNEGFRSLDRHAPAELFAKERSRLASRCCLRRCLPQDQTYRRNIRQRRYYYGHEPRDIADCGAQYHFQHHRTADGYCLDGDRRTLGQRTHGGHDRRARNRSLDLQLHLLELQLCAHGHQRPHGSGLWSRKLAGVYPHAGALNLAGPCNGCTGPAAAGPLGRALAPGDEWQRGGERLLLRPHLGRARRHPALRA